jgi:MFS family permease
MQQPTIQRSKLFWASCIALIFTSLTFSFRAAFEPVWGNEFTIDKVEMGWVFSPAFWGFTLAMIFGGTLVDAIGMRKIVGLAFVGHVAGAIIYIFAKDAMTLFIGTLCIGIGNGMVEAACNPLVVTLYPTKKTTMLNRFHVWFPGGNVIGGLLAYIVLDQMQLDWRILMVPLFIAAVVYGIMFWSLKFPKTERVTQGVSTGAMFGACLNPLFIVMILCMFLTAATELGTMTWVLALLGRSVSNPILVLVFVFGIMAVGRFFAGPVVHRLNPNGMLIFSAVFSGIGLVLLSMTTGTAAFASAAVFAVGICFFWPTMLGFVSEYMPKTGALGLSLMGGAGMFSVSLILPIMGGWLEDYTKQAVEQQGMTAAAAEAYAGSQTLLKVAIMPAILLVVFSIIYVFRRKHYIQHSRNMAQAEAGASA